MSDVTLATRSLIEQQAQMIGRLKWKQTKRSRARNLGLFAEFTLSPEIARARFPCRCKVAGAIYHVFRGSGRIVHVACGDQVGTIGRAAK